MTPAQRRHLVAAYSMARHKLQQMEELAAHGRSPTGLGPPLSPLPPDLAEPFLAPLRQLCQELRSAAAELAPEELANAEAVQGRASTLIWLSNLLEGMRAASDSLSPARLQRYGSLAPGEQVLAADLVERLEALLNRSRAALAGDSRGGPPHG